MRFRIIGSGSSGNATLVEAGRTRILIDAGLGPRSLAERLLSCGVDPASLTAVLVSHEHSDHSQGAAPFAARWGMPLAGSRGTYAAAGFGATNIPGYVVLRPNERHRFGELEVRPVLLPHDAAEPLAFVIAAEEAALGHATDLGHVNDGLRSALRECSALLIESNYDPGLLREGPYPWSLKERILSPLGHLSNQDTCIYLRHVPRSCRTVVLAHLSQKNNHPELALAAASDALAGAGRADVSLEVAGRELGDWISLVPRQLSLF